MKRLNKLLQDPTISPLSAQQAAYATSTKLVDHYLDKEMHWEPKMAAAIKVLKPTSTILRIIEKDIVTFVSF